MATTGDFFYLDPATISPTLKPWAKVDGGGTSYELAPHNHPVHNIRDALTSSPQSEPANFGRDVDIAGFALYHAPATEKTFTSDAAVRQGYYAEVESLLRAKLPRVSRVVIFDHTIRRHDPTSPRQPVRQVHVDQTPEAAAARVRRHVEDQGEAEKLVRGRFQIINVWRPIGHAASDFPLALVDWRTTERKDLVPVDLLYPERNRVEGDGNDDRGKEVLPEAVSHGTTEGYEVKGETFGVLPGEGHRFWYVKDMAPEEALFIKCFDSRAEGLPEGRKGVAAYTPHTAFVDPATPEGAKPRESIEVRALVFYEE